MSRRPVVMTLADVVAVSVATTLLIGMLCGLVFFLLELLYHGSYLGQLQFVLFCFIVAIVLIARISLAIDRIRAIAYGLALGAVTALAINKFVQVPATGLLGAFGQLAPYVLLGLTWWCAYILTKDCTHTEESADDTGILDGSPAGPAPAEQPGAWLKDYEQERAKERSRHRPGTWLVYFSLAALPLFGVGQFFIPATEAGRRAFAFWMLMLYLGCALGLLATTSFLGLRRYLEQRKLAMPMKMTGVWLGLGGGLILVILLLATLLPRPQAELGLGKLMAARSQERAANRHAPIQRSGGGAPGQRDQRAQSGGRGERDPNAPGPRQVPGNRGQGGEQGGGPGGQQAGGQGQGNQQGQGQGQGNQQGQGQGQGDQQGQGQGQGNQQGQGQGDQQGQGQGDQGQSDQNQRGAQRDPNAQRKEQPQRDGSDQQRQRGPGRTSNQSPERQAGGSSRDADPQTESDQAFGDQGPNQANLMNESSPLDLGTWWLWLLFLLALGVAAYWYRKDLLAWLQSLWPGAKPASAAAAPVATLAEPEPPPPPPPFSTYRNPFEHLGDFTSHEEVVRYSFDAYQSWAYEQRLGRQPEETPLEFADRMGDQCPALEKPGRRLAELYARVTYAEAKVGPKALDQVRQFWDVVAEPVGADVRSPVGVEKG
ncbi:MAG TPA: DUF4129 domain-containing protein [Gemmatales bacterium]|nr:DUF4129 domain-containing protein [Gemmatales bacterium]